MTSSEQSAAPAAQRLPDNETEARRIATELADELHYARSRPMRPVEAIDRHLDETMARLERLAIIVARIAAGSE